METLLVVGHGGREHAIARKLLASPRVARVYCAPGNAGMVRDGIELAPLDIMDFPAIARFCREHDVAWVFVGSEDPLAAGIVDYLREARIPAVGPTAAAARIEASKSFAKRIMAARRVPTARSRTFSSFDAALAFARAHDFSTPFVVKADGLAAGKGVTIAADATTAQNALAAIFSTTPTATSPVSSTSRVVAEHCADSAGLAEAADQATASAGAEDGTEAEASTRVVVEEYLEGQEFSLFHLVGPRSMVRLGVSQDHKRAFTGDRGPNTGGMGAYTPVPQISEAVIARAEREIVAPVLAEMRAQGCPFTGMLYSGLMLTAQGPKVIEFNCRFGDPETQVLLEQMDSDLAEVVERVAAEETPEIRWRNGFTVGIMAAADGYPGTPLRGFPLGDLPNLEAPAAGAPTGGVHVYFSGVAAGPDGYTADGGRLFMAVCHSADLRAARDRALGYLDGLKLEHVFYHRDIAARAL
ncbi:phosphoribosylamine--glycine ligase [Neoactinobaculum massilliense]|uniref:phosphoribosylamine--glycine ligase n=1 Tax=Neoactinobaculum massilliense TaxID=2364794 RepID=UPI0013DD9415|nr:phosphoribosylamine--glycine ligase [Neoactinobaculum massilliense]